MTETKRVKKISGRKLALLALTRIEQDEAFANRVLNSLFHKWRPDEREKGLATEVVYGTLRHLALINHLLGQLLTKPLTTLPVVIRNILRLSLYQLLSTPAISYAVVNEGVSLAKQETGGRWGGLVNAVLRRYLREGQDLPRPKFDADPLAHLSIVHSHPRWLVERWVRRWGIQRTHELVKTNNLPAPFTIRTNTLKLDRTELLALLTASGLEVEASPVAPEGVRIRDPRNLAQTSYFDAGYYFIQDESSMLVAHLLAPQAGKTIVDLCAAPGGKATHLAQVQKDAGRIFALDNHPHKTLLIQENAARLGIQSITALTADARSWSQVELRPDAVLLDAPCTGTGVLRRRPDIRWRRSPENLSDLVLLQQELLENAVSLLKPGGRLIYSTCSIEAEENEEQIAGFIQRHPEFSLELPAGFASCLSPVVSPEGLTILPREHGADGFFMTRLVKR